MDLAGIRTQHLSILVYFVLPETVSFVLSAFLVAESISEVRPARRETECCSLVSGTVAQLVEHPSKVQVWCSSTEVG